MSSKVRALVWEELRVGGSIVGVLFVLSLLVLGIARSDIYMRAAWERSAENCLVMVLGVPMFCSLLLALNIRNSGHMGGGFSRRILRLPVDTGTAVAVQLSVRLAGIVLLTLALSRACQLLFGHGGGWHLVLLMAGVYLFVQMMDWSRAVLGMLAWMACAVAVLVPLFLLGPEALWERVSAVGRFGTPALVAGFALGSAVLAGASWLFVQRTRRGARIELMSGAGMALDMTVWRPGAGQPFGSSRAALFSYEMRRVGLYLPKSAAVVWLIGVALFWLSTMYGNTGEDTAVGYADAALFATHFMPLLSVVFAALTWPVATMPKRARKGGRRMDWAMRIPATGQERELARLKVAAVNLGVALGVAGALHVVSFLAHGQPNMAAVLGDLWSHGESTLREMVMICAGPVVVTGLIAWTVMTCMPVLMVPLILATLLIPLGVYSDYASRRGGNVSSLDIVVVSLLECAAWAVLLVPVAVLAMRVIKRVRRGRIARSTALKNTGLWFAAAVLLFPFGADLGVSPASGSDGWAVTALLCLVAGSWLTLGWTFSLSPFAEERHWRWQPLPQENPEQHLRRAERHTGWRACRIVLFVVVLALLAWLRWPAASAGRTALERWDIPNTLAALDAWYEPVPDAENLAARYIEAMGMVKPLEGTWRTAHGLASAPRDESWRRNELDNIAFLGNGDLPRTAPIPASVWTTSRGYWDTVSRHVAEKLHETARLGLTKSRYPIDLRKGPAVELPHLAKLGGLARHLALDAWVAAMERRPQDAVNDMLDTFPIADSLAEEPLDFSQYVRIGLDDIVMDTLESCLNRTDFSEGQLAQLQRGCEGALPPLSRGPFMNRVLAGDATRFMHNFDKRWSFEGAKGESVYSFNEVVEARSTQILGNLLAWDQCTAALYAGSFRAMQDEAEKAIHSGCAPVDETWTKNGLLMLHAPMFAIGVTPNSHLYESEWRLRTNFDMARTALAVERFRLAQGRLPERLEELVPAFLERVPGDPWNGGKPLSYRVRENGEFVVYSFAKNGTDEKGEEVMDPKKNEWTEGDMTFTVAPPEVRQRPQVADTPVAAEAGT